MKFCSLLAASCAFVASSLKARIVGPHEDLPNCAGTIEHVNCTSLSEEECPKSFSHFGLDYAVQCALTGNGTCLPIGPRCVKVNGSEPEPVEDGFEESSEYATFRLSPNFYTYFGSLGDWGGHCVGASGEGRVFSCRANGLANGKCNKDGCASDLDGSMNLCDSIPSCRGFSQHYGYSYFHISPDDMDKYQDDGTMKSCTHWETTYPPICTNLDGKVCGNNAPTNNCLLKKWEPTKPTAPPPLPIENLDVGFKTTSNYAVTQTSKTGNHYFGSTGDVGGKCVDADGEDAFTCYPKGTANGHCTKDKCTGDLDGCMNLCDSIPSCKAFTQHYGGCRFHLSPDDREKYVEDGTMSYCTDPRADKTMYPPVCTNRDNKYCGNSVPTHNCLIKKEGR